MKRKSLLDPSFRYTPSFATNVTKTFAKARREIREATQASVSQASGAELKPKVVPMDRKRGAR